MRHHEGTLNIMGCTGPCLIRLISLTRYNFKQSWRAITATNTSHNSHVVASLLNKILDGEHHNVQCLFTIWYLLRPQSLGFNILNIKAQIFLNILLSVHQSLQLMTMTQSLPVCHVFPWFLRLLLLPCIFFFFAFILEIKVERDRGMTWQRSWSNSYFT